MYFYIYNITYYYRYYHCHENLWLGKQSTAIIDQNEGVAQDRETIEIEQNEEVAQDRETTEIEQNEEVVQDRETIEIEQNEEVVQDRETTEIEQHQQVAQDRETTEIEIENEHNAFLMDNSKRTPTSKRISVLDISPYHTTGTAGSTNSRARKRKSETYCVLTSTPYKKMLEEKAQQKEKMATNSNTKKNVCCKNLYADVQALQRRNSNHVSKTVHHAQNQK